MIALQKLRFYFIMLFLFHLESSFRSRGIQIFVFPCSPLFLPVSHCFRGCSNINFKVYDVNNCLNKNLITNFVWYLWEEKKVWHWNFVHWRSIKAMFTSYRVGFCFVSQNYTVWYEHNFPSTFMLSMSLKLWTLV